MKPDFADALSALVNRVQKDALPLWLEKGLHQPAGWFSAHLSRSAEPLDGAPIQLLTQAHILYVIARAEHLGWTSGRRKIARDLIDFVGRHGTLPCRSDGYVRTLQAPSVVLDGRYDPQDHVWFVIANTACFAAFGEMSDLRRAYNILDWLHIHFADDLTWKGIDRQAVAEPDLYRQILRAFLYLAEVTQKPAWHQRAKALFERCAAMFSLPAIAVKPAAETDAATVAWREQLSWVRVLCRCDRVLGVGLSAAETFFRQVASQKLLSTGIEAQISAEIRAEVVAAGLALLGRKGHSDENVIAEQLQILFRDYEADDIPGLFVDEPWQTGGACASLATLVRLVDAAILAQPILTEAKTA